MDTYKIKHAEADQALYCHIDSSPLHGCCSFLHVAEHTDVKNKKEGTKSEAQAYHRTLRERLLFSVTSNKRKYAYRSWAALTPPAGLIRATIRAEN